jgi:hypothetical protein
MLPPTLRDYYLEIRCPRCSKRARWEEPFEITGTRDEINASEPGAATRTWGPWRVREKFPSVVRWRTPRKGQGWQHYAQGVVRCGACNLVAPHRLRWPDDAFFRWNVRGTPLWAWHAEHARVLLDHIGARVRDPFRYPHPYPRSLQRLPADVLAGRNRERVARQIAAMLAELGVPVDPPLRPPRAHTE